MSQVNSNVIPLTDRQQVRLIDQAGAMAAQIRTLQKQLDEIKEIFTESGDGVYEGKQYKIVVNTFERRALDAAAAKAVMTAAQLELCIKGSIVTTTSVKEI
jgi:ribosomal protein S10